MTLHYCSWSTFMWRSHVPRRQSRRLLSSCLLILQPGSLCTKAKLTYNLRARDSAMGFTSSFPPGWVVFWWLIPFMLLEEDIFQWGLKQWLPCLQGLHLDACTFIDYREEPRLWARPWLCLELTRSTNSFLYIHKYLENWFLTNPYLKRGVKVFHVQSGTKE